MDDAGSVSYDRPPSTTVPYQFTRFSPWLMRDNDLVDCLCCVVHDKWYMIRIDVVYHDHWEMTWLIGKN